MKYVLLLASAACLSAAPEVALAADDDARTARLERLLIEQQERISRLEAIVAQQSAMLQRPAGGDGPAVAGAAPVAQLAPVTSARVISAPAASPAPAQPSAPNGFRIPGLDVAGDVRLREEYNFSDADARDRARTVLRARLRATYAINGRISVGGQLATGDADDPNSTDITLTGFNDDLDFSLDQAWVRYSHGGLTLWGGKFPQIFARTDMVWDGDVVPEGVGGAYSLKLGRATLDARAIYFIVDEAPAGKDSDMLGGQVVLATPVGRDWNLTLAGSYYDYRLASLAGGDAGDFRSNLMAGGRYLSDFNLIEGMAIVGYGGLGQRWPVTLTGDYVKNLGAAVSSDSGFNVELAVGRAGARGDWRFFYAYSEVGVDAVFAAFSNDNLNIATNYRLHGLSIAHVPVKDVVLDATFYHYRPLDRLYAGGNQPRDWLNRVRFNMLFNF